MSNHTKAIIPIGSWWYASPDLMERGKAVDIGLFVESLVYYEQLLVYAGNVSQFSNFISWFIERNLLDQFESLIQEGTIRFYDFAFYTVPLVNSQGNNLYNIVDPSMSEPNAFHKRILEKEEVAKIFPDNRRYEKFCKLLEGNVIEGKADSFEPAIDNAKSDYINPRRNSLLLQSLLDEMYSIRKLGAPPTVQSSIVHMLDGQVRIDWNLNLEQIAAVLGVRGVDYRVSAGQVLASFPLSGAAHANRLIMAAMHNDADMYLPRPISVITGDKLYEASQEQIVKGQVIIDDLQHEVDFPDLRHEINEGNIGFKEVLLFRKKGRKFREWLQNESERDREAIIAYHNEVAKEAHYKPTIRKGLRLFGLLGGGAVGSIIGALASQDPVISGGTGSFIGSSLTYLAELGSKLGAEWKPVVFGTWYKDRIGKIRQALEARDQAMNPLGINRAQRRQELRQLRKMRKKLNKGK